MQSQIANFLIVVFIVGVGLWLWVLHGRVRNLERYLEHKEELEDQRRSEIKL